MHRVGTGELGSDLRHAGNDALTRQRMPHEHHRQTRWPGDAPAALRDVLDGHLDVLAHGKRAAAPRGLGGDPADGPWPPPAGLVRREVTVRAGGPDTIAIFAIRPDPPHMGGYGGSPPRARTVLCSRHDTRH